MATLAALFGTLPIAFEIGAGVVLRQPLGIVVVVGLLVSQALILFTTPVTYPYMEGLSAWSAAGLSPLRTRYPTI